MQTTQLTKFIFRNQLGEHCLVDDDDGAVQEVDDGSWKTVGFKVHLRRYDIQQNATRHNDTQHNDTQYIDTQYIDTQHNDIQHDETEHNDTQIMSNIKR